MKHAHWYLIAYDIREARRLRRIHYRLKKHAWMIQKSVYLIRADKTALDDIFRMLKKLTDHHEDDIRLYPVQSPAAIWEAGPRPIALQGLAHGGRIQRPAGIGAKLKNLFKRKRGNTRDSHHRSKE